MIMCTLSCRAIITRPNIYSRVIRWIWDWAQYHISHISKSIKVTKLFFCQNGVLLGRSFWPKESLVTLIIFELWVLWYLAQSHIHRITLYIVIKAFSEKRFALIIPDKIYVHNFSANYFAKYLFLQVPLLRELMFKIL